MHSEPYPVTKYDYRMHLATITQTWTLASYMRRRPEGKSNASNACAGRQSACATALLYSHDCLMMPAKVLLCLPLTSMLALLVQWPADSDSRLSNFTLQCFTHGHPLMPTHT